MALKEKTLTGSCLCGAVVFDVDGPVKWCGHCHCDLCRRAHGAAFVTWFGVAREHFTLQNDEALAWYASSEEARRGFCSRCGSTMFFASSRWADEMHIALPYVHGAFPLEPSVHVYWDRRVSWVDVADDQRKLGGPSGVEELD